MKYLLILSVTFFLGFTAAESKYSAKISKIEAKVKSVKEINEIEAADIEIEILNTLIDHDEWSNELIEEVRRKTTLEVEPDK